MHPRLLLPVAVLAALTTGRAEASCLDPGADCTLRQMGDEAGILVGTATSPGLIEGEPLYASTLAQHFSSITAEVHMKWDQVQGTRGVFDFRAGDALVDHARAHDMAMRGHTLLWAQKFVDSTPDWVDAIDDPDELREVMATHIRTTVGHWKGRIDGWDVVNEPLETTDVTLYDNVFHRLLGPGYIDEAFALAHEADPDATLFLNEIGPLFYEPKFEAFYDLVTGMLDRGVPLHGVGLQGHFVHPDITPVDHDAIRGRLQAFADLGLVVEITELDIGVKAEDPDRYAVQRNAYFDVVRACAAVDACSRITTWGFTDAHSWLNGYLGEDIDPLIFDEGYARKPAFYGYRDGLASAIPEPGTGVLLGMGLTVLALGRRPPGRGRLRAGGPPAADGRRASPRSRA